MDHNIQLNIDISGNVLGLFAKEKKSLKKNFKNFHLQTYQVQVIVLNGMQKIETENSEMVKILGTSQL